MKLKSRRLACQNTMFNVFFDTIADDLGNGVDNFLVISPKKIPDGLVGGVAVLPVLTDGRIGLIHIYRHPIRDFSWEVPRGFMAPDETVEAAAQRELREETGLDCKLPSIYQVGCVTPESGVLAARLQVFVARDCFEARTFTKSEGIRELRFFRESEIGGMIARSEIEDPSTIVAYYRYTQERM